MQVQKINTSICIVGAGPAGTTASIFLARHGIRHVLVDAAAFPRDKICGDGLDLNVIRVLNHIDPALIHELQSNTNFSTSKGFRFILPGGRKVDIQRRFNSHKNVLADKPVFFVGKRSDFDTLLLSRIDTAYTDLRLQTKIETIRRIGNTWLLEGHGPAGPVVIETGFLVGADGDHSLVLRHLGERKVNRSNYAAAVRQYWSGVGDMSADNLLEVYFPKHLPMSYFWIFPLPGGKANVGYGMASSYIAKKKINVRTEFEKLIKTDPNLIERFKNATPLETVKGWGIPMSGSNRKAYGDGWLLLGDAASLVCPTSGEGIGSGMLSGYVAAEFLQRAATQNNFSESQFANYQREIHRRLVTEEKIYRFVNRMPGRVFSFAINTIIASRLFKYWLGKKTMHKWVNTAYNTPIDVSLD
jgi:menaquinone-9 beta-reductase